MDAVVNFFLQPLVVVSITGIRSSGKQTLATMLMDILRPHMDVEIRHTRHYARPTIRAGCVIVIGPEDEWMWTQEYPVTIKVFVDCDRDLALCRRVLAGGPIDELFAEENDVARLWRASADVIIPNNAAGISNMALESLAAFVRM